ncbi:MAG: histidine triad nucleotide-binding protein [candidate division Zixibacteria bacterium]|nr:histidine triad nucleotide-binding protein [candidate division Zixibacteria bacterium]
MSECLFCRIAKGELPVPFLHEDEEVVAFADIHPQAPVHVLLIPRRHVATVAEIGTEDETLMDRLTRAANRIAREKGIDRSGYRLVVNCNAEGGQTVFHLHMHLLGGRSMQWPPG